MKAIRIFFTGVGGQGNVLATKLVGLAAVAEGLTVSISETHGMAQRGGVVESSAVINARSPIISEHEADVIVAFEPLEALRAMKMANKNTVVITSLSQIHPFTVAIGRGEYPDVDKMLALLAAGVKRVIAFDAMHAAKSAGNPLGVNMVMLGALVGSGDILLSEETFRQVIRTKTQRAFLDANLNCFDLGLKAGKNTVNNLKECDDGEQYRFNPAGHPPEDGLRSHDVPFHAGI